jgi:hypothetical protein
VEVNFTQNTKVKNISNLLETMTDSELFERYRFRRPTIEFITNGISHLLTSSTRRNKPFLPIVQILLFLRFVATKRVILFVEVNFTQNTKVKNILKLSTTYLLKIGLWRRGQYEFRVKRPSIRNSPLCCIISVD